MKKALSAALALVLLLGATAGCSSSSGGSQSPASTDGAASTADAASPADTDAGEAAPAGGETLNYWCSFSGDSQTWDEWRVEEFEKATGNTVNAQYVPNDGGIENGKLMAAIAGGTAPDLLCTSAYSQIYTFAGQGSLEPWDPYWDEIGIDESELLPGYKGLIEHNGQKYLMPQDSNVLMLYYNKDMFTEVGLDPDNPPKNLEELDAAAEKLTIGSGGSIERMGFIPWFESGSDAYTWPWMFGADIYDPDTQTLKLTDQKMVDVFNWYKSYSDKYSAEAVQALTTGAGGMFSPDHPFMTGKLAMVVTGNWYTNALRIYAPDVNYGVAPIPVPDGGRANSTVLMSNVFVLPKGTKNPALAAQFYSYILQPHIQASNYDDWRSIPFTDSMFDDVSWTKNGDEIYAMERVLANSPESNHPALTVVSAELSKQIKDLGQSVIFSGTDPATALADMQTKLQAEIDKTK